jgi:RNA polymerase II elongation factor ELL
MATAVLPKRGIALVGAPESDMTASREVKSVPMQAMQVEMTQDIVDELLESVRNGKAPQILFGRTPVCVHTFPQACSVVTRSCCCGGGGSDSS